MRARNFSDPIAPYQHGLLFSLLGKSDILLNECKEEGVEVGKGEEDVLIVKEL